MKKERKPAGYWTYNTCYDIAKKCNSKSEFYKKNGSAYDVARRNGWLKDYTWFKRPEPVNKKWNYKSCYNEAQKYKSCAEFERNNSPAYNVARVNGWIKDYTWFEKRKISDKNIYTVYCYKDEDTNAVYVGLTMDMKRRHREHKFGRMSHGEIKHDTVYKYFNSIGKDIPEPIILHKDIHAKDAQKYEKEYVEKHKKEGNLVLNLAKTGSLGGYGKWNYQTCYEEAQKYKSRWEFRKGSCGAYDAALKNGWLDNYTWFEQRKKPAGYWNYENCYNEAKKYKSIWDFQKNSKPAFDSAKKHGWLKDYTWIGRIKKPVGYWNYENCYNEAKKYKSSTEFKKGNQTAYIAARKNKWISNYTWFKRPAAWNKKLSKHIA